MTALIPPRQDQVEDKERRFYIVAPSSVYLSLQQEAIARGSDLWTLGGTVLAAWLQAGCPDFGFSEPASAESPASPPPSSSPLANSEGSGL